MRILLNFIYGFALFILSPWLLYKALTTGKYRRGLWRKLAGHPTSRPSASPCVWFHGVSVGEIHLLRPVVARFRLRHPDWVCVVSTTTDTGFDEASKHFGNAMVIYWPLDFSWAVRRSLRNIRPSLVILAEGELWPNFLSAARVANVPVAVINGRMSPRTARRYSRLRLLVGQVFRNIDLYLAQTEEYAGHVRRLGARPEAVKVTGSVKYDAVVADRDNPRTEALRRLLAVQPGDLVWIAGSTQAPEEEIALDIYRRARAEHPELRLILVPRQKDRFDEVAQLLARSNLPSVRRSTLTAPLPDRNAIVLVDTIGELGALWGLANVTFVGGSLDGIRGGQNMIEPAAYGAAVVFGPHVWNFRETAVRLVEAGAALQVADAAMLDRVIRRLLHDPAEREQLGQAARGLVAHQQGATERTLDHIDSLPVLAQSRSWAA